MGCIGVNEMCFFKFMKWDEMSSFGESFVFVLIYRQVWHFIKGFYFGLLFLGLEKVLRRKARKRRKIRTRRSRTKRQKVGLQWVALISMRCIFQIYEMR